MPTAREGTSVRYRVGLLAILAAAGVTRSHRLTSWPLFGDEFFTLADSASFSFSLTQRPLLYWMNHTLVQPMMPLDELGLRLLPALFGVLGIGLLVEIGRRLANERAGLLAGLLAVLSPWHLMWSQTGRYYTLVFLLAAVAPAALYLGVRSRSRGWLAAGVVGALLAWLAHPTAILPTAGFVVWLTGHATVRTQGRRRILLLGGAAAVAVAGLAASAGLLAQWSSLEQSWGIGGIWVAAAYGARLTAGPAIAAAAGMALLWIEDRRELALFLAAAVVVPLVVFGILGEFVSVHTGFLFATAPYALLAAAVFLDGVVRWTEGRFRSLVVGAAVTAVVAATGLPSFVSHYVDGSRPDFRGAARHVEARAGPGDLVLADQRGAFNRYTPSLEHRALGRDTARIDSIFRAVTRSSPAGELWVVPYIRSQGGFGLQGLGPARRWVWSHCRLSARLNPVRIDYQRNIVEVWRCSGPPGGGASE